MGNLAEGEALDRSPGPDTGGLAQLRQFSACHAGRAPDCRRSIVLTIQHVLQHDASFFFQILTIGIADGAIYALIALGYTMVYGIIELINFAHGDVFTLGAFISLALFPVFGIAEGASGFSYVLPLLAVGLITMALCAVVNVAIERVAYRPLRHAPRLAPLITAIGMSSILEGAMYLWKGPFNLHYPDLLPLTHLNIGGVQIGVKDLIVLTLAIVLVVAFTLFINLSKLGKAMRATAQDRDAAQLMGIDINRTISATFFIGAVLAGAGGSPTACTSTASRSTSGSSRA